jgi:hypothetical protein
MLAAYFYWVIGLNKKGFDQLNNLQPGADG